MSRHPETAASIAASICPGLVSGVLSSPRRRGEEPGTGKTLPERIRVRRVTRVNGDIFQLESLKGAQAFHENIDVPELESRLCELLGSAYSRGEFVLTDGTVRVLANRRGELTAIRQTAGTERVTGADDLSPACATNEACGANGAEGGHNLTKNYILAEGEPVPFLVDLGVMGADGRVIHAKYDKFRQINRFLEFIADIVPELTAREPDEAREAREISIVDFGCGKSYLTFAVYHYLHVIRGLPVRITGLDLKADVIARCSLLAGKYGFKGLTFRQGDIAGFTPETPPDMVISLHACDTATDLALAQALRWKSRVILSVPCCQHELNTLLSRPSDPGANVGAARETLAGAFKFGIIRERLAALFTDVRRAEILESRGYRVQILEFIDMSHTPKNLLIRAVHPVRDVRNARAESRADIPAGTSSVLGDFLGERLALERQLEPGLGPEGDNAMTRGPN